MQSILGDKRGPTRVYGGICKDVCELLQVETRDVKAIREARARGENYHMAQCEKSKSSKSRVRPAQFVPACQPGCEKMERE